MKSLPEIRTEGPWPQFTGLDVHLVPDWIARSVDELTAAHGDKIRLVFVDLYANYYHDDNSNIDTKGCAGISPVDHNDAVDQDDLDHVPAMRRMERRADEVWNFAPFDADDEGYTNGEFAYHFTRDGFDYAWNRYEFTEEPDYEAQAVLVNGIWEYEERIILFDFNVSETTLAINDTTEIMEQISADDMGLSTMPDISRLTHKYNPDEGSLIIIAKGGGLFEHHEPDVA